ncbi:MAG TPA: hypothetical protein VJ870_14325 [Amycolatopsis sp.]|nr:hypothetical protein [Amycolatopsis sp.]
MSAELAAHPPRCAATNFKRAIRPSRLFIDASHGGRTRYVATLRKPRVSRPAPPRAPRKDLPREVFGQATGESVWVYIDHRLGEIVSQSESGELAPELRVDGQISHRFRRFLFGIVQKTSVFPKIAPDGANGLSASWFADDLSLQLLLSSGGVATAVVDLQGSTFRQELNNKSGDFIRALRGYLGDLSVVSAYVHARQAREAV